MAITYFGSGICSQTRRRREACFRVTMPGDDQDIRVPGRSFDEDPETLDIETGHQACDDLDIAGIAGPAVIDRDPRGFYPRPVHEALAYAGVRILPWLIITSIHEY